MFRVIERSQPGQMDLCSLPVRLPVRQTFVDQLLSAFVYLAIDLDDLYTLPLRAVNLSPHRLVVFLRFDLRGVESLLRNSTDGTPPQLIRQHVFAHMIHARPYGFQLFLILDVVKEGSDHLGHLLRIA